MNWDKVGNWLKENGTGLLGLVGAVATGGAPAGIAAAAALIGEATGTASAADALKQLQSNPETLLKLEELAKRDEADLRAHQRETLRMELEDQQKAHEQQQETIRNGDNSQDEYVRHTRPKMARQSWYATIAYCLIITILMALGKTLPADIVLYVGGLISLPALAYIGARTLDKRGVKFKSLQAMLTKA